MNARVVPLPDRAPARSRARASRQQRQLLRIKELEEKVASMDRELTDPLALLRRLHQLAEITEPGQ